jgi:hypothetical protein
MFFDVVVQIPDINEERRTLAIVEVGQVSILNQPPQFPLAHAEVLSGLSRA